MWTLTEEGVGVGNDTVVYMAGGENIFKGKGFNWFSGDGTPRPITHYPFFFSVLLGLAYPLEISILSWAHFLQIFFFVISNIIIWLLTWRFTRSLYFATLTSIVFLVSEEMLSLHSWVMSDALFLLLVLLFLLVESSHGYSNEVRRIHLIGISIIAALAALTRYIGVSLIALLLLRIAVYPNRNFKHRIKDGLVGFFLGAFPLLLWLGRNWRLTGSLTNRRSGWYPQDIGWWMDLTEKILEMFIPGRVTAWLFQHPVVAGFGIVFGGIAIYWGIQWYTRKTRGANNQHARNSARLDTTRFFSSFWYILPESLDLLCFLIQIQMSIIEHLPLPISASLSLV
jgi:Ca2+/Na+ antiporter